MKFKKGDLIKYNDCGIIKYGIFHHMKEHYMVYASWANTKEEVERKYDAEDYYTWARLDICTLIRPAKITNWRKHYERNK